jgi:hypothetical protein
VDDAPRPQADRRERMRLPGMEHSLEDGLQQQQQQQQQSGEQSC